MPPGRTERNVKEQHEASGIEALPDGVLEHILGLLPAEEAVRTCVLARRWRHRWKTAAALRIVSTDGQFLGPEDKLREFMDRLLVARGGAPLELCELRLGDFYTVLEDEGVLSRVDHWFLACCWVQCSGSQAPDPRQQIPEVGEPACGLPAPHKARALWSLNIKWNWKDVVKVKCEIVVKVLRFLHVSDICFRYY
ncbi:hypothetical protein EJB05_28984, partial [Eragrostis curvula]